MPFEHIDQISEWLAGTGITLLELSGPHGSVRLVGDAVVGVDTPALVMVTSPGIGHFLHRHSLSLATLAPAGALVDAGQIVGLLQVGVLLIPILAPCAGRVAGHLVAHGEIVDFGMKLIGLHPLTSQGAP